MEVLNKGSHKRYNPLTGEWVLVSPHRNKRPWQGEKENIKSVSIPDYDPNCYLCPGNSRAEGKKNPNYDSVFVFDNDFPALTDQSNIEENSESLFRAEKETGICRVICYSPDHSRTMADLSVDQLGSVIRTWQSEYAELGSKPNINHVQIFENKGLIMGCSNPHPHGQIWAQSSLPNEVLKKDHHQREYFSKHGSTLLQDYIEQEIENGSRTVIEDDHFVAVVPFWAVWPFEVMIMPKNVHHDITSLRKKEISAFSAIMKSINSIYDQVFQVNFPYSMGIHQAPTNASDNSHWHFHMSFYPPLLRSASVKKFMVGYEMFGMPQRDISPEEAASRLRSIIST